MFLRSALRMFSRINDQCHRNVTSPNNPASQNAITMLSDSLGHKLRRPKLFSGISPLMASSKPQSLCNSTVVHRAHPDLMLRKTGGPVSGISAFTKKERPKIVEPYQAVTLNSAQSDEPWSASSVGFDWLHRLDFTGGPVVLQDESISVYHKNMKLKVPTEVPCTIDIYNNYTMMHSHGLGCYFGSNHVLTACHLLRNVLGCKTHVTFTYADTLLAYNAEYSKSCRVNPSRDLGFIELIGDTTPLGEGSQNQMSDDVKEGDSVYLYTRTKWNGLQKQEGQVVHNNYRTWDLGEMILLSVAGWPGDSGSPVYSKGKVIGIFIGVLMGTRFGVCSKFM